MRHQRCTESGEDVLSCAIITMPANELLAEIHNAKQRMPLILTPEAVDTWLTGTPEQATDFRFSSATGIFGLSRRDSSSKATIAAAISS